MNYSFRHSALLSHMTTFLHHVCGVISLRAQREMSRIDTGRVIATMHHAHPFRDRAIGEFVSDSVRPSALILVTERPITLVSGSTSPYPARIRLINLRPKAVSDRLPPTNTHATPRTEAPGMLRTSCEVNPANFTHAHKTASYSGVVILPSGSVTKCRAIAIRLAPLWSKAIAALLADMKYTFHVNTSHKGVGRTPDVSASRGLLVPNYTTSAGGVL
jgi:hypothetical protein